MGSSCRCVGPQQPQLPLLLMQISSDFSLDLTTSIGVVEIILWNGSPAMWRALLHPQHGYLASLLQQTAALAGLELEQQQGQGQVQRRVPNTGVMKRPWQQLYSLLSLLQASDTVWSSLEPPLELQQEMAVALTGIRPLLLQLLARCSAKLRQAEVVGQHASSEDRGRMHGIAAWALALLSRACCAAPLSLQEAQQAGLPQLAGLLPVVEQYCRGHAALLQLLKG